jgi:hypothetical protein
MCVFTTKFVACGRALIGPGGLYIVHMGIIPSQLQVLFHCLTNVIAGTKHKQYSCHLHASKAFSMAHDL